MLAANRTAGPSPAAALIIMAPSPPAQHCSSVSGSADRAQKALDQARDTAGPGNGELAGRLLDIIRDYRAV